jgi:hypothetical protein
VENGSIFTLPNVKACAFNGPANPADPIPSPPASTQFHPRSPNPPKHRQRVTSPSTYRVARRLLASSQQLVFLFKELALCPAKGERFFVSYFIRLCQVSLGVRITNRRSSA